MSSHVPRRANSSSARSTAITLSEPSVPVLRSTCTNWHAIGDWKNTADATDDAASASM